jgi:hypothetical protein
MAEYDVQRWVALIRQYEGKPERDRLVGVTVKLAARLLGISRSRVHQLLRSRKLVAVNVRDERGARIGHMVSLWSIGHRRRTVRPRKTQFRSHPQSLPAYVRRR